MANRPRSLVRRHAGTGLEAGSGGTLDVDLYELTAKTTPVMADSFAIVDSDDNSSKKATLTNALKILGETAAGTASASGLTEVDGVLKVAPTDETLVVSTGYLLTQNAAGAPHKDAVADIAGLMAGSGIVNTVGVLSVLSTIANVTADDKSAHFVETGEFDFSGSAGAVDTKKIDTMVAKGQLLFALLSVSQVADGTTSAVISISKAPSAATKMASDLTIALADTVYQNKINNLMMMWPVAGADSIVASGSTGDVYLYAAASAGRTAGKVRYALVFMKTA